MHNVMIDTETLGQRAGCVVLSIGAVAFDPDAGTMGPGFYLVVNTASCKQRGLYVDASTEHWWRGQSPEARKVLQEAAESKVGLGGALQELTKYLAQFNRNRLCMWSQGADFDLPIIAHCYAVMDMPLPWNFWNNRCHRTLRALGKMPKRLAAHNALTDAQDQAAEAMKVLKIIRSYESLQGSDDLKKPMSPHSPTFI
jgi:hypothetical protein